MKRAKETGRNKVRLFIAAKISREQQPSRQPDKEQTKKWTELLTKLMRG